MGADDKGLSGDARRKRPLKHRKTVQRVEVNNIEFRDMSPQQRKKYGSHSPAVRLKGSDPSYPERTAIRKIPACSTEYCFGSVSCISPSNGERYACTAFSHCATIVR